MLFKLSIIILLSVLKKLAMLERIKTKSVKLNKKIKIHLLFNKNTNLQEKIKTEQLRHNK